MRTTINSVDRRGDAHSAEQIEKLESVLLAARRLLVDTSAYLELEVEKLGDTPTEDDDQKRLKTLQGLLGEVQKTMRMVLDLEAKLCFSSLAAPPMNLEAAREEILGRLARLS